MNPNRRVNAIRVIQKRDVRTCAHLGVQGSALVRVLAIGEVEELFVGGHPVGRIILVAIREPAADRGVVAGRVCERFVGDARKPTA